MSAFSPPVFHVLCNALETLNRRMYSLYECNINAYEVFDYFVPKEDQDALHRAQQLGARSATYNEVTSFKYDNAVFQVDLRGVQKLVPNYLAGSSRTLTPDLPFFTRISEYIDKITPIADEFANVRAVLSLLDKHCKNPKQVRFFMPGITTLFMTADMKDHARVLTPTPKLRSQPTIPMGTRQAIIDANATIAKATLLPTKDNSPSARRYSVRFGTNYVTEWGDTIRRLECS
jgi:hypothetical protein